MIEKFNKEDRDLLIRLDERFDSLERSLEEHRNNLKESYVTKIEFAPIQRAVYAAIGFILTGFLGALLTLVLKVTH